MCNFFKLRLIKIGLFMTVFKICADICCISTTYRRCKDYKTIVFYHQYYQQISLKYIYSIRINIDTFSINKFFNA